MDGARAARMPLAFFFKSPPSPRSQMAAAHGHSAIVCDRSSLALRLKNRIGRGRAGGRMTMTLALSILTMKTLGMVAREIERQMYGQWNHCAIYESDLQRLCPHTGLTEMARAIERLDREFDVIKKTVDRILHKVC
jgi:hypothetical protein